MLNAILARIHQGHRTIAFPKGAPTVPDRFRGRPVLDATKCADDCRACIGACPTGAVDYAKGELKLDLGKCLFCPECEHACPHGAIRFTPEYRMATDSREELVVAGRELELAKAMKEEARRVFGRSLKLRQVSAGGCNGCESDVNVLNTVVFDLGRVGVQFVASPRHADGLLITGPVTRNMQLALQKTYEAVPTPKFVIAVGACAIAGGPYIDHPEVLNGAASTVPVDLFIPGCPPHPITILDGLLRFLGALPSKG